MIHSAEGSGVVSNIEHGIVAMSKTCQRPLEEEKRNINEKLTVMGLCICQRSLHFPCSLTTWIVDSTE